MRAIEGNRGLVEIRDFPLGANSFLELIIDSADSTQLRTPVRVLKNTAGVLEVEFERTDPGIYRLLTSGVPRPDPATNPGTPTSGETDSENPVSAW